MDQWITNYTKYGKDIKILRMKAMKPHKVKDNIHETKKTSYNH